MQQSPKKSMRIAIFSDNFYPELSGISDSIIALSKELAKNGHRIDFYVPNYPKEAYLKGNLPTREIDFGEHIKIHRFHSLPYKTGTGQGRFVIPDGFRTITVFKSNPDVIHTQLFFGVGLEAIFAAWVLRKPVIGTNHTAFGEFLKYSPIQRPWFTDGLLKYVNWYYERCELVTAPARFILDEMTAMGFKMGFQKMGTRVVSNPVDVARFHPPSPRQKAAWKKRFRFSGPTVVYAGRFASEKKVDVLIEAFATLLKKMPGAMLALAGHGPMQDDLEHLSKKLGIKKSVKFVGTLSREDLVAFYGAADLSASASTSEVQSLTMLEAMASGLPFVGVNAPGITEHVNQKNGRIAEVDDRKDIARTMAAVLHDQALRETLGRGALAFARHFSANRIAAEWGDLYREVAERYNKRIRRNQ